MSLRRRALGALAGIAATLSVAACSCDEEALNGSGPAASGSAVGGLTPELAAKPLAKVGDQTITLGDYAATIDRMGQFERLRYQSASRRKKLLDEIITVELLAAEAKRRGLDEKPETRARVRQLLRDIVLKDVRAKLPAPNDIPEKDVRAYYDEHRDEFREPERRRVAQIVMTNRAAAEKVLAEAKKATPMQWGKLVQEHSADKPPRPSGHSPLELAGDVGIVSAPGSDRGKNVRVEEPVRKAVFAIKDVGGVHDSLVEHGGKFYIVRLIGKTAARDRTFAEAQRSIRVTILQKMIREAEAALEAEMRKKHPVQIDEEALKKVTVPGNEPEKSPESAGSAAPEK